MTNGLVRPLQSKYSSGLNRGFAMSIVQKPYWKKSDGASSVIEAGTCLAVGLMSWHRGCDTLPRAGIVAGPFWMKMS